MAHAGPPPTPATLWSAWSPEPLAVVAVVVVAGLYACGVAGVRRRAGRASIVPRWQVGAFGGGLAATAVAVASPLDALAGALFAAHMAQHLLLTVVAAPLLALGGRRLPFARALPPRLRRGVGRWERRGARVSAGVPVAVAVGSAVVLHAATFWVWHTPALYEAAVADPWVHAVEHATMLGAALLLWAVVVAAARRGDVLVGVLALFATSVQEVALAALLTLSSATWYTSFAATAPAWGLSPLADQQLGGALMWSFGGLAYVGAAAVVLVRGLDGHPGAVAVVRPEPSG